MSIPPCGLDIDGFLGECGKSFQVVFTTTLWYLAHQYFQPGVELEVARV